MQNIDNPYHDMMMDFDPSGMKKYFPRLPVYFMDLWRTYTWGIVPSNDDARFIARFSPLLEIGAGSGYWARLISQAGAKIDAYDALIPDTSSGCSAKITGHIAWLASIFPAIKNFHVSSTEALYDDDESMNLNPLSDLMKKQVQEKHGVTDPVISARIRETVNDIHACKNQYKPYNPSVADKSQDRFSTRLWYPVKRGTCAVIEMKKYERWTLLMIRPPSNPDLKHMALDCISRYKGDVFVYAGEIRHANASAEFFDHLDAHFDMVDAKRCIQTSPYLNFIIIYARKGTGCSKNDAMIREWIARL